VRSPYWDNGAAADAGAVTWGNGGTGITGVVTIANSLVGSSTDDEIGYDQYDRALVKVLSNGNYVVVSPFWDNGATVDVGAVTWGDGATGIAGPVSAANSLVGRSTGDKVGHGLSSWTGLTILDNGSYVVRSPYWDNGTAQDAGAVTLGNGGNGTPIGPVHAGNSVLGATAGGGASLRHVYDYSNNQLVVGRPADNTVTLFRAGPEPVAYAGDDRTVCSASLVTLDGSASYDPEGDLPLAFGWTQSGGTPIMLSSDTISRPTFIAPVVVTHTDTLTFTLVVTDALGLPSSPDRVTLLVEPYRQLLPVVLD
jgi:hypothetical protein